MLDTTVLFAGIGWPRWSYEVLRHGTRGDFQLVLSALVLEQARQHLAARFPESVESFEAWLELTDFELVDDPTGAEVEANANLVRDLKDVPIALAAIAAQVDYLVSEERLYGHRCLNRCPAEAFDGDAPGDFSTRGDGLVKTGPGTSSFPQLVIWLESIDGALQSGTPSLFRFTFSLCTVVLRLSSSVKCQFRSLSRPTSPSPPTVPLPRKPKRTALTA